MLLFIVYFKLTFLMKVCAALQVNVMLKDWPEEEYGPQINFREYSFFENPLMPRQVILSASLRKMSIMFFPPSTIVPSFILMFVSGERVMA